MDGGLLSLKWNNHRSTFFHVLSSVRKKERYSDATLACDGKFYKVHKLVMSTCSEYFEQMFEQTDCKNPVIVLKDIKSEELESLLSYMYVGEVNVVQEKLAGLIKAAECLKIKGLAVPDEEPQPNKVSNREKRSADTSVSSDAKRRKEEVRQSYNNRNSEERRKSSDNNKYRNSNISNTVDNSHVGGNESNDSLASNNQNAVAVKEEASGEQFSEAPQEVTLDDPQELVKQEPNDMDAVYIDDSNSASESKDMLMDNFDDGDGQQHFMDELLGQNSDQGNMGGVGNFNEVGEGSAGGSQQHMMKQTASWPQSSSTLPPLDSSQFLGAAVGLSERRDFHQRLGAVMSEASITGAAIQAELSGAALLLPSAPPKSYAKPTGNGPMVPFDQLDLALFKNVNGYTCPCCGKVLRDRFNFRDHYMSHSGEKPLACHLCAYTCLRKKQLLLHYKNRHPNAV